MKGNSGMFILSTEISHLFTVAYFMLKKLVFA